MKLKKKFLTTFYATTKLLFWTYPKIIEGGKCANLKTIRKDSASPRALALTALHIVSGAY